MLWPGASKSPMQWPGWELLTDGTYVETEGNFAWTRDGVTVVFEVNPRYQTSVAYPPESSGCATPPSDRLSHTGADTMDLVPWAAALVGVGVLVIFIGRRRREED